MTDHERATLASERKWLRLEPPYIQQAISWLGGVVDTSRVADYRSFRKEGVVHDACWVSGGDMPKS